MEGPNKFQNLSKEELIERLSVLQEENSQIKRQLTERQKELHAIYQISTLMDVHQLTLAEILQETVNIIPKSWQYPEITCVRIIIGNIEYKTTNFQISEWKQSEVISIQNNPDGIIEIYYLEERPAEFEGPFLKEERDLLKLIAGRLGKISSSKLIEEEFTTIFNESPIAKCVIDLDQQYRFTDANQVFLTLTGYNRDEIIGKIPSQIGLFRNAKIIEKILKEILQNGFIKNLEYEYVTKNGQVKSTILNSKVIHINGRNLAVASFIDLTDIKKAEDKLKERNILNATLINTIPYGMDIIDESGTILFANENMKKLFGTDIIGKKCWQTYLEKKKQCKHCPLRNGLIPGETKINVVSGIRGNKVFEISHTDIIFEGQKAILEIFHDITSLKEVENNLRLSEEKFRLLFENMKEGFASHELITNEKGEPVDYRLINVNSAFEKILNIPVKKAQGALASELYGTGAAPYLKEYADVAQGKNHIHLRHIIQD